MAGLATSGSNPDVSLLYDINGLARTSPEWVDRTVAFLGEYGLLLGLVLLVVACWWSQRRHAPSLDAAASGAAALLWALLAAGAAVLVNVPIRGFVERARPFVDHDGIDVLIPGKHDFSFVSDHATLAMAMAAGLFVVHRKYGLTGLALALAEGFCRVFMGVHYPTDVIGGFALGTAVVLLLSPLASAALTPLAKAVGGAPRAGWLIWSHAAAARTASADEDKDKHEDESGTLGALAPEAAHATEAAWALEAARTPEFGEAHEAVAAHEPPGFADAETATGTREPSRTPSAAGGTEPAPAGWPAPVGPADALDAVSGSDARGHSPAPAARTPKDEQEPGPRDPKGPREPDLAA